MSDILDRLRVRITTLASRGGEVCADFVQPPDGGVSCISCGYQRDVHLCRDALVAIEQRDAEIARLRKALTTAEEMLGAVELTRDRQARRAKRAALAAQREETKA